MSKKRYGNKADRHSVGDGPKPAWGVAAAIELRPVLGGNAFTVGNRALSNVSGVDGLASDMLGAS